MTNYTKATDFAAKDALLTGNPAKVVKGVDINTEFVAIETAITSKADTSALAASGGSALSGYLSEGTGAIASTVQDELRNQGVNVKRFGALGDNSTNDGAAIVLAEAAAYTLGYALYFPAGTYYSTTDLTFRCDTRFDGSGIRYGGTGIAVTLTGEKVHWNLKVTRTHVTTGTASTQLLYTGVRFLNCKNATLYNPYVAGFAAGMNPVSTGATGCGYLRLYNPYLINNLVGWDVNSDVTNWVNECDFFGGKIAISETFSNVVGTRYIRLLGTPTAHKFHSTTLESTVVERKIENQGNDNLWIECYMEGNNGGTDIQNSGLRNHFSGRDSYNQVIADTGSSSTYWGAYYKKIGGGFGVDYQTVTAAGTTDISNVSTVYVDTTLGNITLRLLPPNIYQWKGLRVTVIKTSNDANTVTVYPLPSGPALDVLTNQYAAATYENNGTAWYESGNSKVKSYTEYTAASTACTGAITTAAIWKATKVGNVVTLTLPALLGAGVATPSFTFGVVLPTAFRPVANVASVSAPLVNNGANQSAPGLIFVSTTGGISVFLNGTVTGNFTVTANAGLSYVTSVSWTV